MKTHRKIILILFILLVNEQFTQAQVGCPNLNFSQLNFTNWVCRIASSNGVGNTAYSYLTWTGSSAVSGRHTIMTNIYGYDPHTCNGTPNTQLSLVPDGFNQSARIGNDNTMYEADAIIYQMTVDSNNALLILHFAVVFDDPSHPAEAQPGFEIRIQGTNDTLLNIPCNRYIVTGSNNIPGFQNCGSNLLWRDWTTLGISLYSLIGQTIYVAVATADCGYGGHYGYGYVVAECGPMKIQAQYCEHATVARFDAPDGFVSYVWRDASGNIVGTNKRLSVPNPIDSAIYTVTLTSAIGCVSTLSYVVELQVINPDFTCDSTTYQCHPSGVILRSIATSTRSPISYHEWNITKISEASETEYVGYDSSFTYYFKDTGYYKINYTVYNENNCADTSSVIVYSYPSSTMDLNIHAPNVICKNTETEIYATGADSYEWIGVKRVQSDTSAIIDTSGMYVVKGKDASGCAYDTAYIDDMEFFVQYTTVDNKCIGYDSGEIKITKITGDYIMPMHHYWEDLGYTNGIATAERKNLASGNYVVYNIDDYGCSRYDTITLHDPLPLGTIGEIKGDSVVKVGKNYIYYIHPVQSANYFHWIVNEITSNGNYKLLDTITKLLYISFNVVNPNPIEISVYAFNECDTGQQVSKLVQCENSIKEYTRNEKIVIYPNPTSDILNIQDLNGIIEEVILYDIIGKEVKRENVNHSECILNMEHLHSGLYFISINNKYGVSTYKIVKK